MSRPGGRVRLECRPVLVLLLALHSGCGSDAGPSSGGEPAASPGDSGAATVPNAPTARFRVEGERFSVRRDDPLERISIPYSYRNDRDEPLYHPTCRGEGGEPAVNVGLERRTDGGWEQVWVPVRNQCLSEPVVVEPGGIFRDTVEVALHPQDTLHQPRMNPRVPIDGVYRLVWIDLLRTYDPEGYPFGEVIPLEERVSGPFQIRR